MSASGELGDFRLYQYETIPFLGRLILWGSVLVVKINSDKILQRFPETLKN